MQITKTKRNLKMLLRIWDLKKLVKEIEKLAKVILSINYVITQDEYVDHWM